MFHFVKYKVLHSQGWYAAHTQNPMPAETSKLVDYSSSHQLATLPFVSGVDLASTTSPFPSEELHQATPSRRHCWNAADLMPHDSWLAFSDLGQSSSRTLCWNDLSRPLPSAACLPLPHVKGTPCTSCWLLMLVELLQNHIFPTALGSLRCTQGTLEFL